MIITTPTPPASIPATAAPGEPLRVLLWSLKGSGEHYGGPGSSAYRLYKLADPARVQVTLAHANPEQERYELFKAQHLVAPFNPSHLGQWRFVRAARHWIRDHCHEFDVFHGVQGFHSTVVPAFEAHRRGVPAAIKLATYRLDLAGSGGIRRLLGIARRRRRLIARIGAIICISRDIQEECRSYGIPESKLVYLPDGANTAHFRPAGGPAEKTELRNQLGLRDLPTVVLAGGMVRRKRPDLLIEAAHILRGRGHEIQVVLVGPPHEAEYVQQMQERARQLNVEEQVVWAGFHADIAPFYRAADVFCLPSSSEGLPNAMLEAMASGLPPVATAISGHVDLIDDGERGRFVEQTGQSLASALEDFLREPALLEEHARRSRAFVEQHFDSRMTLQAHLDLFRRLLAGQPAAV